MEIEILSSGAFRSALVHLQPGETFHSEAGAMYRASANVDIDVTTRSKGKGGILRGVKRMLGGESFFFSTYSTRDGSPGEVGLSPTLPGEVHQIELDGGSEWITAGGSYLGSGGEIELDTQFQGLKGFFTGESVFFMLVRGHGTLLVSSFGRVHMVEVDGELTVDTSHLVCYEASLHYKVGKIAGSWTQSFLSGEGLAIHFSGRGRVYLQSHAPSEFGKTLGPLLPERS